MITEEELDEMRLFKDNPSQLTSSPMRDRARDLLVRGAEEIVRLRTDNKLVEEYAIRIRDLQSENEELQAMTAREKSSKKPGAIAVPFKQAPPLDATGVKAVTPANVETGKISL